jgi:hypothetical protein
MAESKKNTKATKTITKTARRPAPRIAKAKAAKAGKR